VGSLQNACIYIWTACYAYECIICMGRQDQINTTSMHDLFTYLHHISLWLNKSTVNSHIDRPRTQESMRSLHMDLTSTAVGPRVTLKRDNLLFPIKFIFLDTFFKRYTSINVGALQRKKNKILILQVVHASYVVQT
jgi:hypothetical protein